MATAAGSGRPAFDMGELTARIVTRRENEAEAVATVPASDTSGSRSSASSLESYVMVAGTEEGAVASQLAARVERGIMVPVEDKAPVAPARQSRLFEQRSKDLRTIEDLTNSIAETEKKISLLRGQTRPVEESLIHASNIVREVTKRYISGIQEKAEKLSTDSADEFYSI